MAPPRKSLRNRISAALPANNPLAIRLRSLVTIGEYVLSNPTDLLSTSPSSHRVPGMKRLHIFFRHVHAKHNGRSRDPHKSRPEWFSHELCFNNLIETLDRSPFANRVSVTVVYDGTEAELAGDFVSRARVGKRNFEFKTLLVNGGSNIKSWLQLLEHIERSPIPGDEIIYFLENDYLHVEHWLDKVVELYDSQVEFDYLSLYDHTDFYETESKPPYPVFRDLRSRLHVTKTHHWREAPSTCGTFLLQKHVLLEDMRVWTSRLSDFYAFTYLSTLKRRILVTPVPGLSTHCMTGCLAPTIDWGGE